MTDDEIEDEILECLTDTFGRYCSWNTALTKLQDNDFLLELSIIQCDKKQLMKCVNNLIRIAKNNIVKDSLSDIEEDFK